MCIFVLSPSPGGSIEVRFEPLQGVLEVALVRREDRRELGVEFQLKEVGWGTEGVGVTSFTGGMKIYIDWSSASLGEDGRKYMACLERWPLCLRCPLSNIVLSLWQLREEELHLLLFLGCFKGTTDRWGLCCEFPFFLSLTPCY